MIALKNKIAAHDPANGAMSFLIANGCRSYVLMAGLYALSLMPIEGVQPLIVEHANLTKPRRAITALIKKLHSAAGALREIRESPEFTGILDALEPSVLETYAAIAQEEMERLAWVRPSIPSRHQLVMHELATYVRFATGQPHWGRLAYLFEAAFWSVSRNIHFDVDSVRKIVVRCEERAWGAWAAGDHLGAFNYRRSVYHMFSAKRFRRMYDSPGQVDNWF